MLKIDQQCFNDYKTGIAQMCDAAKTLTENSAANIYTNEYKRISIMDTTKALTELFDKETENIIFNLFQQTIALTDATIIPYSVEWKRFCFYKLMSLLKAQGVKFSNNPSNNYAAHAEYLELNKDIISPASLYLISGSFLLYYISFVCRRNEQKL